MATFELYLIADKAARKEVKNPFYTLLDDDAVIDRIFEDFAMDPATSRIICGHVPVKVKDGDDPVKAAGRVLCIDGGFSADVLGYGTIFATVLGHSGVVLFLVIAIMSQCTIYNTYLASGSRSFWVLSEDNLFPKFIRKVDKAGRSPYVGVLTIAASSLVLMKWE